MAKFTDEEIQILKVLQDPVAWAEATLRDPTDSNKPVHLRDYQKIMLATKSPRKVSRCGRRIGKTFTMCIHMLHYAFTNKGRPQIVVTPYDSQVSVIFEMLRGFIANSPELAGSVKSMNKAPYHKIEFLNGSIIKGFTAGTRSGSSAGSVRGQAGDWVYMDEVDYMTDGDFETIYAVAADQATRGVWISSTPTGKRGKFWLACNDKRVWKEFYYPSMVNPGWGPEMEADFKSQLTEQGYIHEVMAEFGEETVGVFKKEYVDRARLNYGYIENPMYRALRVIGVDWDKYGDASQIVVMEYNATVSKFQIINRVEIPKSSFTLDNGVKKIIELNAIYNPEAIYVDRGYGEYQVEILHKYGIDHPDSGMSKKVVGISFAESKAVIDPFTRITENKPIKPFMVNQLVLLFERDRMIINDNDEMIIRQLENYRMLKKTASDRPIFTNEDEHTIDCMMLAVLGFIERFPQVIATIVDFKPSTKMIAMQTKASNPLYDVVNSNDSEILMKNKKDYLQWDEPGSAPLKKVDVGSRPDRSIKKMYGWSTRGTNMYKEHKRPSW